MLINVDIAFDNQTYAYLIFYKILKQTIYIIFPLYISVFFYHISLILYSSKTKTSGNQAVNICELIVVYYFGGKGFGKKIRRIVKLHIQYLIDTPLKNYQLYLLSGSQA